MHQAAPNTPLHRRRACAHAPSTHACGGGGIARETTTDWIFRSAVLGLYFLCVDFFGSSRFADPKAFCIADPVWYVFVLQILVDDRSILIFLDPPYVSVLHNHWIWFLAAQTFLSREINNLIFVATPKVLKLHRPISHSRRASA
jgi:hypothetical protein